MTTDTITMATIEKLCLEYKACRDVLADRVQELQDEMETAKRARLRGIKSAVGKAAELRAHLVAAIEAAPELFARPRTQVFHAVKVGFRKGTGKMEWDDEEAVVQRIEKMFAAQAEQLLVIKKKPSKEGLETLGAADLKKLGVTVEDAGDVTVCKPVDGAVDKLVNALLKDAEDEAME